MDFPLDADPINRRAEEGPCEIKSRLIERRLPLLDYSLGILEIGLGHVLLCFRNCDGLLFHPDLLEGTAQVGSPGVAQSSHLTQVSLGSASGARQLALSQELSLHFILPGLVCRRLSLRQFLGGLRIRHRDPPSFPTCSLNLVR